MVSQSARDGWVHFLLGFEGRGVCPQGPGSLPPLIFLPMLPLCSLMHAEVPILTTLPSRSVPEAHLTSKFTTTFS